MNKETIDYTSEEFWATAPSEATIFYPEDDEFYASFWQFSKGMQPLQCWVIYPNKIIEHHKYPTFNQRVGSGIPRPNTFTDPVQESSTTSSDWFVNAEIVGIPEVGEMVEAFDPLNEDWHVVKVLDSQEHGTIAVRDSKDKLWWTYKFRLIKKEPTIQEKILEAWKAQGIDFAYDNEDTHFSFKVLVDFVVNNFDVKERD